MLKQGNRWIALGTLGAVVAGTLLGGATPVQAKSSTWKKVAIGAGIVTGYGLLKGKKKLAIGGGVVTGLSYLKYRSDKKKERRARESAAYRASRYSAVSPYRYNGSNYGSNGYRSSNYRNTGYRTSNYRNTAYRSGGYNSNGYRNSAYSGRSNWSNGQHRGWTKGKHKGAAKKRYSRTHRNCKCRR